MQYTFSNWNVPIDFYIKSVIYFKLCGNIVIIGNGSHDDSENYFLNGVMLLAYFAFKMCFGKLDCRVYSSKLGIFVLFYRLPMKIVNCAK